jgi:hypothetical protein
MKTLSKNWLTESHIDFEFKQYMLMAYLADVDKQFNFKELYPTLGELVEHYRSIKELKNQTDKLYHSFQEFATSIDLEQLKIHFKKKVMDDEVITELNKIMEFSIPQFEAYLNKGKEIYDDIEDHIELSPVGLQPLEMRHGYLLFKNEPNHEYVIYSYQASIIEIYGEPMQGIHFKYLSTQTSSIVHTPEHIKLELIKQNKDVPNPATYLALVKAKAPFEPTVLPITKRKLMQTIYRPNQKLL